MKKGDIAITALIIIVLGFFIFSSFGKEHSHAHDEEVAYALIYVDGDLYEKVALTAEEREIEIKTDAGYNLLKVHDYGIEMVESNCPDHICIGFGHIHLVRENIVCLPNRIFVEIQGGDDPNSEGVDAIVS